MRSTEEQTYYDQLKGIKSLLAMKRYNKEGHRFQNVRRMAEITTQLDDEAYRRLGVEQGQFIHDKRSLKELLDIFRIMYEEEKEPDNM